MTKESAATPSGLCRAMPLRANDVGVGSGALDHPLLARLLRAPRIFFRHFDQPRTGLLIGDAGGEVWLIERRRIGPVIRALRRDTDRLFRPAGLDLDRG